MITKVNFMRYRKALQISRACTAAIIFLFIFSCDNFTEVELPQSELTGAAVYQDAATAKAALSDIYARMREGGIASGTAFSAPFQMSNYSDDLDFYGTNAINEQFNRHTMLASNANLLRLWNSTYGELYAINALIEGVQVSTAITGEDRDRLLGEAYFLRAFNHFYLVNIFGDIPYVTSTDYQLNSVINKTPTIQVWQKIINDLSQAETLLPGSYPGSERVRANKACVHAMLAKVYLYTQDYAQADAYATLVLNDPTYSIEPNPALAFLKESPSIIWSFHPGIAGQNTKDATTYNFSSGPPTKPVIATEFYNSFETGDLRKSEWIKAIANGNGTWYRPFKYKQHTATEDSQEFSIILRLEEMYLVRAEARAVNGDIAGAQQDLNITRQRAGLPDTPAVTSEQLKAAILQERRFEFFTEQCHRWFDLKRTGNAAPVLSLVKPNWQTRDLLLPIPDAELLLNENLLPQNPGY